LALFALAFGSGFGVMVLEIAGARVMAPVFGLSAVPWTAVIGVVLTALAIGNWVGGRLADAGRVPLAFVLLATAATAIAPLAGTTVPRVALELLGFVPGAVATAAVFFALPVFGLGMVTPYLVRAETRSVDEVGRRAGEIGAVATAGSIAGTFGTGFVLLPLMPLPILLGATAAGLVGLAALAGFVLGRGPAPTNLGAVAFVALSVGALGAASPPSVLADEQTVYTSILVREGLWTDGEPVLEMRQSGASSSVEYVATGAPAHPYATMSMRWIEELAEASASPMRVLVIGGAALTLPLAIARRFPDAQVDVVELDPRATALAYEHFAVGTDPAAERISVTHGAGRHFLETTEGAWDLIYIDAFDHLVTVPWTLVTEEAFHAAASRLRPGGTVAANVLAPLAGAGDAFMARLLATGHASFPSVRAWRVTPEQPEEVVQNVLLAMAPDGSTLPMPDWEEIGVEPRGPALVDAWAPIDALQARVFWGGLKW
jgi:predicted membrane-bound spermidine synthase